MIAQEGSYIYLLSQNENAKAQKSYVTTRKCQNQDTDSSRWVPNTFNSITHHTGDIFIHLSIS